MVKLLHYTALTKITDPAEFDLDSDSVTKGIFVCGKAWYRHITYIIMDFLSGVVVLTSVQSHVISLTLLKSKKI